MMNLHSAAGFLLFAALAWGISENRKAVRLKNAGMGLLLQLLMGILLLKLPICRDFFLMLNRLVLFLEESTQAGTSMVFGYLGGASLPFDEKFPGASYILAFRGLPLILLMSALSSLLFYWKILPFIVKRFSYAMRKSLKLGGAEALGVSANIFVGMVESPLFIRPYLKDMSRSEIFTLMTCGMATIAGTVMVLYASILSASIPGIMGHILTASIISVPAAVTVSKIMIPETEELTSGDLQYPEKALNAMDAVTKGTMQGIELLINVIAMLIVLVALVHLLNLFLGLLPDAGAAPITLQRIMGILMAPFVWLMGIPWSESLTAGSLMGTKIIINEFVAYLDLSRIPQEDLSLQSRIIITYAMCGFANPGSLGIMIGGMGTMAPEKKDEIVSLGFRSVLAGTLATCMTGCIVGMIGI
ncbi:MAG: nucleoside transporter C-terminal domain-containing protein [Desulfococcaceae bacterium]|jgi:CNT family concentrative nucleoside transporter|nr:nucleoside transporter C-terminal domain-containing protein [Desulfococcaceae bacterium]